MPTPLHISQRRFATSKIPQTNYNTQTPFVDANFVEFLCKDKNFTEDAPVIADNKEYATGRQQPTEQWIVAHEATAAKEEDVCSEEIGRPLLCAMGKVTTTQPDATNVPTIKKHVFERLDVLTSRQLPALTLIEQLGIVDRAFPSCVVEALGFRGEGSQRLSNSRTLRGSGKIIEPTGVEISAAANRHYFYESQVTLTLDDGAEVTNFATAPQRLNAWAFDIANQILNDDGYRPGAAAFQTPGDADSGEVRTEALVSDQVFNASFNGRFLSDSELYKAITNQKNFSALFDIVGSRIPVDTTEVTQGGDFNNITDPVVIAEADYPSITFAVDQYYKIGSEILKVTVVAAGNVTLVRGQFLTSNAAHADGVTIYNVTYTHRLQIEIAKMPFKTRRITERNGLVTLDIVPNILFDVDTEKDVTITLYNEVTSYTV
jgi:hypothetical protein